MAKFAVLGYGVVGSGTVEVFYKNKESLEKKAGQELDIKYILDVRDFPDSPFADKFTKDFEVILNDPEVTVVAEVIGGLKPAYDFVKSCLLAGKSVVTSNKEMVAAKGAELLAIAKEKNVNFFFEASVGGGIPIIKPLHACLSANEIDEIAGILNGTTNFILTKMMGYRQMSQMSMFDYIIGITIGSIAAEMSTSLEDSFTQPLTAMIVYAFVALVLAWLTSKSIKVRRVVEGEPLVLLNHGELYRRNLKKAKMDVTEFLAQCRVNGYFDVSKLECAILEGNGKISFLPKVEDRPVTPSDMQLTPEQDYLVSNVILDGKIMNENLKNMGKNEKWLHSQITAQGAKQVEDVLLATCDRSDKVSVYLKDNKKEPKDLLI